ncbi:MAG: hypothetical protein IIC00_10660 [Planctomycetes bacterium]|nr:hypothetical protein [Planctomycetota bacterium]
MENRQEDNADLLPRGTPLPTDFWQSPTIEELAASQGVNPMADVRALFGTWPGEDDDGFEDSIHQLREQSITRGNPS